MYGYIYLTTNLINGRKYIGQKKSSYFKGTDYLGSGKLLVQAVEKYGRENFRVDLLEECNSREELDQKEIYWINLYDAVNSKEYYNLAFGGGSPVHILSEEERKRVSIQMRELQKSGGFMKGKTHSDETKKRMSESHKGLKMHYTDKDSWRKAVGRDTTGELNPMYGKSHSGSAKVKMSEFRSDFNKGRVWMTNEIIDKFVDQEDVEDLISQGFRKGRKYSRRSRKSSTTIESVTQEKDLSE